jgi:anti-sigma regulatory factor (Ser/Thr protein kinase)
MTFTVRNEIREIERLSHVVADFCSRHSIGDRIRDDVNLALDEVVANVILHGFENPGEHDIVVGLYLEPEFVNVTVEDAGVAFNPLDAPEPDLTKPIEERPIGGLGIHLVRNVMDQIEYRRDGDRNRLTMRKRL